jgi:hypothetical protein
MLTDVKGKFIVVAITKDEARLWLSDATRGTAPAVITRPANDDAHMHVKEAQTSHGHGSNHGEKEFLERISKAVEPAADILVVGHGKGKSNAMIRLIQHLERHHSATAKRVVGAIDANLPAMTEPQILATARNWFEDHKHELI